MTKVIAQYNGSVILEDSVGKFLFSKEDDIIELPHVVNHRLPVMNVHYNIPKTADISREVRAMLS